MEKGIAVLDFGGQYAHLIANRLRRLNVYAGIHPPEIDVDTLTGVDGVVLSGGPASVYAADSPRCDPAVFTLQVPILGLCYGHQLIAELLGGQVRRGDTMEFGAATLYVRQPAGILDRLQAEEPVWMSHRDTVVEPPPGFSCLATTADCPVAAMADETRRIYGLQFHPEVTQTTAGMTVLDNFVQLCGCERTWTMERYIQLAMDDIVQRAAGRNVFLLVSGGVDSTVSFVLLNRALGADRVLGLHIDNGFMRKEETARVRELMRASGFSNLHVVDDSAEFLQRVAGIADPEEKRRRIGAEFLAVRDRALAALDLDPEEWLLGQGTLYTDTIESGGTQHAEVIKTHHNRVDMVARLLAEGKVIEPLAQLYKDEVRELGDKLGLPRNLVWRHPFPGPGLAVRVLCSHGRAPAGATAERWAAAGAAAGVAAAEHGLKLALLPVRSVGVQGDSRTYAYPAAVAGALDWDRLEKVSTYLVNAFSEINRVVYLLTPERLPPLHLQPAYLTRERLDVLREADELVMETVERHGLMDQVTQFPVVLLPLTRGGGGESLVLRPVATDDFMTARFCRLPPAFLDEICARLLAMGGIDAVFYDITHKPPGTVEWE